MEASQLCLQCSKKLKGRSDKRFCSERCRCKFNYVSRRKKSEHIAVIKKINGILKKNREILERLYAQEGSCTTLHLLLMQGFDFNHYTYIHHNPIQGHHYFCYDMGYYLHQEEVHIFNKL